MTTPGSPPDPYCYPGTRVLINRFNIRDPFELDQAADDISAHTIHRLVENPIPGDFDLPHLARIHEAVWGDLYPWAGEIRTTGIAKDGVPFCPARDVPEAAEKTFGHLAGDGNLHGLPRDLFVERLTGYHGAINYLHPFREGNGRAQRVFLGQLARDAGYQIRWDRLDPAVNDHASHQQRTRGAHQPMRSVFDEIVEDRRPHADRDPVREAGRLHDLATRVRAEATQQHAVAHELKSRAAQGTGEHVTRLLEQRDRLDRQVRAIRDLDDATLGHTHLTADEIGRLSKVAGPDPGRTSTMIEHQVLTQRWDSLHASSQALDELAGHRPADLARRQGARADRITARACALEPTADTPAGRLRATRESFHRSADIRQATEDGAPLDPPHAGEPRPSMPTRAQLQLPDTELSPELLNPPLTEPGPDHGTDAGR